MEPANVHVLGWQLACSKLMAKCQAGYPIVSSIDRMDRRAFQKRVPGGRHRGVARAGRCIEMERVLMIELIARADVFTENMDEP